jgi:hypothetical protein
MIGDEMLMNMDTLVQSHTIRIIQLPNGKWLCKCLSCTYEQESDDERGAWRDKGWHFGRLSTKTEPYGTFAFEEE